ncbi:unnamed protein product [Closterium sp. NIES-53]
MDGRCGVAAVAAAPSPSLAPCLRLLHPPSPPLPLSPLQARKVFEAALRMDGRCGAAVTGLADAHTMDGRHAAAVDV